MVAHQGTILRILRDRGPQSRAELARRSGLSATTLTHLAARLLEQGTIAEGPVADTAAPGRPPVRMRMLPAARPVAGVHIGAGRVQIAICDMNAHPLGHDDFAFADRTPPLDLVRPIGLRLRDLADRLDVPMGQLSGLGVAVLGPVDPARRISLLSFVLGWRNVPFADALEAELRLPTVLEHNVSAMALAERFYGLGRRKADEADEADCGESPALLCISLGRGLGAGLVTDDRVFRPGGHGAVELGHTQIDPLGALCRCGNRGCLETLFADLPPDGLADPAVAAQVLPPFVAALGNAANMLSPGLIVLAGRLAEAPDSFIARIRADLPGRLMPHIRENLRIARSSFGARAGAIGGAAVALEYLLYTKGGR